MTPRISVLPQIPAGPGCDIWRAIIHEGPGHHGTGLTRAEAMINAANAWHNFERSRRVCDESREVVPERARGDDGVITLSDIAKEIAYSWWEAKEYMAKKTAVFLVRLQWFVYPSSKARMEKLLEYERRHIHWSISGKYE